jgi:1-deoxy-D-xylulose-5-phosphate synthase
MKSGTCLDAFAARYAHRFFDVGIAEEGAVTIASGLAQAGQIPVFAVYSTFLQRSYDQLIHDVAMQRLKVVFAIDRAGFVGDDGESHQGLFDCAFMTTVPGMTMYAPSYYDELDAMLHRAVYELPGACAVRYPRGVAPAKPDVALSGGAQDFDWIPAPDSDTVLVTYGREFGRVWEAVQQLKQEGTDVSVLKLNCVHPIAPEAVKLACGGKKVLFFEEGIRSGGIGEHFGIRLMEQGFKGTYRLIAVPDCFVAQASADRQCAVYGLDADGVVQAVRRENAE